MANPLFNGIMNANVGQQVPPQVQQIVNMFKSGQNPTAMLQSMLQQNPQVAGILNMIRNGGGAQQAFYAACQQQGIDPQYILSMLQQ